MLFFIIRQCLLLSCTAVLHAVALGSLGFLCCQLFFFYCPLVSGLWNYSIEKFLFFFPKVFVIGCTSNAKIIMFCLNHMNYILTVM